MSKINDSWLWEKLIAKVLYEGWIKSAVNPHSESANNSSNVYGKINTIIE
jgi:hypothetical protein